MARATRSCSTWRATSDLARTPDFLELAGSVAVPAAKRNASWDEVVNRTRAARPAHPVSAFLDTNILVDI